MRRHWTFVLSLLVVAAIGTVVASSAQERQLGGVGITIFTDSNFRGKSATFREDVSDLVRHGLNDKISSLIVAPGEQWEVCEHTNYQGRCVVVSGEEPELKRHSWSDEISSFRRVSGSSGGGGGPVFPRPPSQDRYIVLYDQPNFRGNPMNYNEPVSNLAGFRAGSVTIGRGVWELCESPNFTGSCVTLDQSVPDLSAYGMRNRVASLRPSGGDGAYVPRPTRPTLPPQGESYIVLYDQPMYRGNPMNYNGPVSNLAGFRAGSVTIGRGVWEVCESPNFRGRCITLDRSVPDLNAYGMRNRVASVRPSGGGGAYVPPPTRPTPPSQATTGTSFSTTSPAIGVLPPTTKGRCRIFLNLTVARKA